MLAFLNDNAGAMAALFAFLLLGATVFYVLINSLMHREIVRAREREERPVLSIRFEREKGAIYTFIIENISNVGAYHLEFIYFTNIKHKKESAIPETKWIGIFKDPPEYIGPKQVFKSIFLSLNELEDEFRDIVLKYDIKYSNKAKKTFEDSFNLNVKTLYNIIVPREGEPK